MEMKFITSYEFRNDTMFLRNEFKSVGMFKLPLVKRQEISLEDVNLIGYDKVNQSNDYKSIVHFFLDDYKFESIYNNPEKKIETLKNFKAVLTPDFSMFVEMPIALQLFATFKNRWVGAYLQEQGIKVIPTVRWGDLTSFNFCFDGIEKGSIVAVSTIGVKKEKSHFLLGYNEMLSRIKPSKIICYGKPFGEMKGDIIEVDYAKTNNLKNQIKIYMLRLFMVMSMVDIIYLKKAAVLQAGKVRVIHRHQTACLSNQNQILNRFVTVMVKKFKKDIMMKTAKRKWMLITQITVIRKGIRKYHIGIGG